MLAWHNRQSVINNIFWLMGVAVSVSCSYVNLISLFCKFSVAIKTIEFRRSITHSVFTFYNQNIILSNLSSLRTLNIMLHWRFKILSDWPDIRDIVRLAMLYPRGNFKQLYLWKNILQYYKSIVWRVETLIWIGKIFWSGRLVFGYIVTTFSIIVVHLWIELIMR